MRQNKFHIILLIALFLVTGLNAQVFTNSDYVKALKKVTDVMVNDVTSPVAASRYYAYINLAAYEVGNAGSQKSFGSLTGTLKRDPGPVNMKKLNKSAASFATILTVFKMGERLLPTGITLRPDINSFKETALNRGMDKQSVALVEKYIDSAVKQYFNFSRKDGFTALTNRLRYTPVQGDAYWQPTAPSFMAPVEPHWNKIKPFLLDSCNQFMVEPPAFYDTTAGSIFMKLTREVYDISKQADSVQQAIAMFWDCNPFAVQQLGHVEFGLKKISPGGHWMGITGIACMKKDLPVLETSLIHAMVSITLADAFIACWDEKYKSNRVRPETVINRRIDPNWRPLLQTPPFPEYVSGHSVASNAAAVLLEEIFGKDFSFVDDTEVEFDLPVRSFKSFDDAAMEASVSRLYGGIHFRDAIDQGVVQGKNVGDYSRQKFSNHIKKLLRSI